MKLMRNALFLCTAGVLAFAGCSSDSETGGDGGGNTGGSGGTGPGTTTGTGTGTTTGTGTGSGDGNDSFETAESVAYGDDIYGTLDPVGSDEDYYMFTGSAGDAIWIDTAAKPEPPDGFNPEFPDLVVTLYDASENQIAQNDDPFDYRDTNDSELWTVLPADGTYYVRVTECTNLFGEGSCADVANITNLEYGMRVSVLDPNGDGNLEDGETGDDESAANLLTPVVNPNGGYYSTIVWGDFNDNSDVDVYEFTVPNDATPPAGELYMNTLLYGPTGPDGCGTTNNIGPAWLTDASLNVLARIDNSLGADTSPRDIRAPATPGTQYFLWVEHPGTAAGANDFYMFFHVVDAGSNDPETAEAANDDIGTPETLVASSGDNKEASYFIDGDMQTGDVDHFAIDVPVDFDVTNDVFTAACGSQRSGSGVRDLQVTVRQGSSQAVIDSSATETEDEDLLLSLDPAANNGLPSGESYLIVQIDAGTPDANVSSRFYQCGFHFYTPIAP